MELWKINSENKKILDLFDQHKNPELWCLFDLVRVCCFTNRLTKTPNVFSKNVYSSLDKFYSTLNTSKREVFIQIDCLQNIIRDMRISLGKNKDYYIERGIAVKQTGKLSSYQ